jgi:serine/threonine-protein kinase
MKKAFWQSDWFLGLVITIVFVLVGPSGFMNNLERTAYDQGVRSTQKDPGDNITVIAIDDESIDNLGRWPWPRTIIATVVDRLTAAGAKVIGSTIILSEEQVNPASSDIEQAISLLGSNTGGTPSSLDTVIDLLQQTRQKLDTDSVLASSFKASGNVVLGMQFGLGRALGKADKPLPDYVLENRLPNVLGENADGHPAPANSAKPPISVLGSAAAAIGHISFPVDPDGGIRRDLLVLDYYGDFFPSLSLMIAAQSLNLTPEDILVKRGKSVNLANLEIQTDALSRMYPFFYQDEAGKSAFRTTSFFDVYENKVSLDNFRDKIVIIGATAYGVGTSFVTPTDKSMTPAVLLANVVASILNQHFFIIPDWATLARWLAVLLVALYLILVLPRLNAKMAAIASALLLVLLLAVNQGLLITQAMWVELMLPATLLVCGYLLLITKRFLVTEKGKIKADEASAQSNRTLGLSYQQQGQLDMAWDKFQACPMDDTMLEPLYSLALDFESKRKFAKAASVYEHIARYNANYKDVKDKIQRSKAMENTFVFGAAGGGGSASSMMLDATGSMQKPKLGRYEIEKELGKGAMGVVYLGKDPQIARTVAIKTMALSQEFEEDELDEVKERFFREAQTAGRLNHPNIVAIYDVGEEHDLAYIAMEFLEGHDLSRYTKKDALLPVTTVLSIITLSAEALNYAHQQNIVHRDIKPANIMYVPESSKIKLTDFGIARITDSSRTKTGMVLGTPSYMSPEQLSGKHVDGRSDLFSLGVMLYQLLTGDLPFKGESMATLMFKIANDPHPEIIAVKPELASTAPCVINIINKALEKNPDNRYQSGAEMSADLRKCLKIIKNK